MESYVRNSQRWHTCFVGDSKGSKSEWWWESKTTLQSLSEWLQMFFDLYKIHQMYCFYNTWFHQIHSANTFVNTHTNTNSSSYHIKMLNTCIFKYL